MNVQIDYSSKILDRNTVQMERLNEILVFQRDTMIQLLQFLCEEKSIRDIETAKNVWVSWNMEFLEERGWDDE